MWISMSRRATYILPNSESRGQNLPPEGYTGLAKIQAQIAPFFFFFFFFFPLFFLNSLVKPPRGTPIFSLPLRYSWLALPVGSHYLREFHGVSAAGGEKSMPRGEELGGDVCLGNNAHVVLL